MFIYRTIYSLGYCWVRVELICVKCLISAWLQRCLLREKEGEESSKESEGELAPVTQINTKSSLFSLNHLMGASPCLQFSLDTLWNLLSHGDANCPAWNALPTVNPPPLSACNLSPFFRTPLSSDVGSSREKFFVVVFLTSQLGLEFFYKETCLQP